MKNSWIWSPPYVYFWPRASEPIVGTRLEHYEISVRWRLKTGDNDFGGLMHLWELGQSTMFGKSGTGPKIPSIELGPRQAFSFQGPDVGRW